MSLEQNTSKMSHQNATFQDLSHKNTHYELFNNQNGTSVVENYLLGTLPILLQLISSTIGVISFQLTGVDLKGNKLLNFFTVILPYILFITVFSDYLNEIYTIIVIVCTILIINCVAITSGSKYNPNFRIVNHLSNGKIGLLFVSRFRGIMLILTAVTILACDTTIFPRRFVKTETVGLGPMDLGVGIFSFAGGLVGGCSLRGSFLLLLFGLGRVVLLYLTNYPQHETEYGKHWNFLFTLVVIRLFAYCFKSIRQSFIKTTIVLITTIIVQLAFFYKFKLYEWAISNDINDDSLITQNRQGIVSVLGFIIIWLMGSIVAFCFNRRGYYLSIIVLAVIVGIFTAQFEYFEISRRAANIGYVLWTVGMACWQLILLMVSDVIINWLEDKSNYVTEEHQPDLFTETNQYGFIYFLLVNLQTGLINKIWDTHNLSSTPALLIIIGHISMSLLIISLFDKLISGLCTITSFCCRTTKKSKTI